MDRETQQPAGRPLKDEAETFDNVQGLDVGAPTGNTSAAALRRLRKSSKENPAHAELYQRVLDGELSPHAAMLEAGFRRSYIQVPLDTERAAGVLARHFNVPDARQPYGSIDALLRAEIGCGKDEAHARKIMSHQEAGKMGGRGHKATCNARGFVNDVPYYEARLERDRPDLYQLVQAGMMSAHAAAIEAGFRRRYIQVPTWGLGRGSARVDSVK